MNPLDILFKVTFTERKEWTKSIKRKKDKINKQNELPRISDELLRLVQQTKWRKRTLNINALACQSDDQAGLTSPVKSGSGAHHMQIFSSASCSSPILNSYLSDLTGSVFLTALHHSLHLYKEKPYPEHKERSHECQTGSQFTKKL